VCTSALHVVALRWESSHMDNKQHQDEVITLWLARPKAQRTASDVIPFHRWLAQHRPTLLGSTTGMQAARLLFAVLGNHVGQTASEGSR
jgi:hypothetical protein